MNDEKTIITDAITIPVSGDDTKKKHACLVQCNGASLGKRYQLDGEKITLGRSPDSGIILNEGSVSRLHAVFHVIGQLVTISDEGSSNGTFVNGERVEGVVTLGDQDMIRVGSILFKFFADDNIDLMIHDKFYRMATIDAGTEVFNKQYLIESLASELKDSKTYERPLCVIYFDLDHFKRVNDLYGHNMGDRILKESAGVVKKVLRKDDVFARFGGEEFIVVLPNTTLDAAGKLAERVRKSMEEHRFEIKTENGETINHTQTVSIGVSRLEPHMNTHEELLESADRKLLNSKRTGRNKITV